MSRRYEVHQFAGLTDGKPSWRKVLIPHSSTWLRHSTEAELEKLQKLYPTAKYRIRSFQRK